MTNTKSNLEPGLSAPWYQLQRMVAYSVGQSSQVLVSELETPSNSSTYTLTVTAMKEKTAVNLANTLKPKQVLGNITVAIVVKDLAGNTYTPKSISDPLELIESLKMALVNNPLVYGIEEFNGNAAICCTPTVVQYYNDDISNPQSFTSMLSSTVFKTLFLDNITVYTLGKEIGNF